MDLSCGINSFHRAGFVYQTVCVPLHIQEPKNKQRERVSDILVGAAHLTRVNLKEQNYVGNCAHTNAFENLYGWS